METVDVAIIGGGPAGLSAGLQLVRARRRVAVLDSNRPRHAATLQSHGFLTRDGASPLELRRLGREEFEAYPEASFIQARADRVAPLSVDRAQDLGMTDGIGFEIAGRMVRGKAPVTVVAARVLIAAGLTEELPALSSIRAYYGTALHSCIACDAYEKADLPLALIGETSDLFERALLLSRATDELTVFTNGSDTIDADEERVLTLRGVRVVRTPIADIDGERAEMTGVRLVTGDVVPCVGGFVRPRWHAPLEFLAGVDLAGDDWGLVTVDDRGETSARGVFAVGDIVPPGPQQLITAAGDGARIAGEVNRDLLRSEVRG